MVKICIIIDHPTRDIPGNIILADKLTRNRNKVYLMPSKFIEKCLLLKPDIVIVNYARPNYEKIFKRFNNIGIKICVNDTEGAPVGKNYKYYPITILKYIEQIEYYFLWGKSQLKLAKNFCKKNNIGSYDKLKVTGSPMFDYHKLVKKKFKSEKKKKTILINTGLSLVNPRFTKDSNDEIKNQQNQFFISEKDSRINLLNQQIIMKNLIIFLKKMLRLKYKKFKVILNPHPFESYEKYKKIFRYYKNIIILKRNNIVPVIKQFDVVCSVNCQTSIDSLLLNKPTYNLSFLLNNSNKIKTIISKANIDITSFKNLVKIIKNHKTYEKKKLNIIKKNQNELSQYFNNFNTTSSDKISKIIKNISFKKSVQTNFFDYLKLVLDQRGFFICVKSIILLILEKLNLRKCNIKKGYDIKIYEKEISKHLKNLKFDKYFKIKQTEYNFLKLFKIDLKCHEYARIKYLR